MARAEAHSSLSAAAGVAAAVAVSVYPYRVLFIVAEGAMALAATVGALQLMTGTFTPPVADVAALGLSSWVLPGLWLLVSVAVPSAVASWMASRRSPHAPVAVLWASGLLSVELAVQVPFVGFSGLQAVLGATAMGMGVAAIRARRLGWCPTARHPKGRWEP